MCRKGVPIYCCNNCSINCLETLFFQGSFLPLHCCLSPFRRPFNWVQCHREGQAFVNISFHKKAYSDPSRTYGITTSQNVFLNICSSCSHFQRLSERAVLPVSLDSQPSGLLPLGPPPELRLRGHLPLAICYLVSCLLRVVALWAASCWSWVSVWPVFGWLAAESQVSGSQVVWSHWVRKAPLPT